MIEPTTDMDFIKSVVTHPSVWPHVSDDNSGNPEDFIPPESLLYLGAAENGNRVGFFAISAINSVCCEIHTTMLPSAWGKTIIYTAEVLDWIFSNTGFLKVITFVPETNKKALNLAIKSGLGVEGFLANSFIRDGELIGQHVLGINRGDVCQ
jgi:RimJ/RimL family protein N-acetyltransferase